MSADSQTNVKHHGAFSLPAASDLTGLEGRLVKIVNSSGAAQAELPTDAAVPSPLLLVNGDAAGAQVDVLPLNELSQFRAALKGTCNPGDRLVPADPSTAADKGKLRVLPATAGTYKVQAIALETGLDGQLVKATPSTDTVTVSGT